MRALATAVATAAILGLIEVEVAALVLSAVALVVAAVALGMAIATQRSFRLELDRQTRSARALVSAATDVESKIRDDDA